MDTQCLSLCMRAVKQPKKYKVTICLTGASGQTYRLQLAGGKRFSYRTGSTVQDWLRLGLAEPAFSSVRVWHSAQGYRSAWLLEWLLIQHMKSGDWWQYSSTASSSSSSTAGWLKGDGELNARQFRLTASGIRENCPLTWLSAAELDAGRLQFECERAVATNLYEQQVSTTVDCPKSSTALYSNDAMQAAVLNSNQTSSSGNPFAGVLDEAAVSPAKSDRSNNPFDDDYQLEEQLIAAATVQGGDIAQIWPAVQTHCTESLSIESQQQPPSIHQQWAAGDTQQQQCIEQQQLLPQLPAVRVQQAQRADVPPSDELHNWSPLAPSPGAGDAFANMPTAEVQQQDQQPWSQRSNSLQQQQVCHTAQSQGEPAASAVVCSSSHPAAGCEAVAGTAAVHSGVDPGDADDDDAAEQVHAAAVPLDDVELKHRGSPRWLQAQQHQQLQVRRTHSFETEAQMLPGSPLRHGSDTLAAAAAASSSDSYGLEKVLIRRLHSVEADSAVCSSSPINCRRKRSGSPCQQLPAAVAPPPYFEHALYGSADPDAYSSNTPALNVVGTLQVSRVQQQLHSAGSMQACAAGGCAGTNNNSSRSCSPVSKAAAARQARRVSGTVGAVKHVPLIDFDGSYTDTSESYAEQGAVEQELQQGCSGCVPAARQSSCDLNRHVSSSRPDSTRISKLKARLPTPKASLSGLDEAAATEDDSCEADAAVAAAVANSLAGRSWQQRQGGSGCNSDNDVDLEGAEAPASSGSRTTVQQQQQQQLKLVRFYEWAEELEFNTSGQGSDADDSSSVESFTEEQLLEAQGGGEFTALEVPPAAASYSSLMGGASSNISNTAQAGTSINSKQSAAPYDRQQQLASSPAAASVAAGSSDGKAHAGLEDVPLVAARPTHKAAEYQLSIHTADKLSAGLPSGQKVHVQLLGADNSILLSAELPRERGSFVRGAVNSFTLFNAAGDVGDIASVNVWHEPDGAGLGGAWCMERLIVETRFKGVKYVFANFERDGWVSRGRRNAVVLSKPRIIKRDDLDAMQAQAAELQRQIDINTALSADERQLLMQKLQQLQARLVGFGSQTVGVGSRGSNGLNQASVLSSRRVTYEPARSVRA